MELLTERYTEKICGVIGCYDRIVITGTLPVLSNAGHLTSYMFQNNIRIFDYAKFAEPYRDQLKQNAQAIAEAAGLQIDFIRTSGVRKEAVVEGILKKRGRHPGLVHIISTMEGCTSYKPWHDKGTHKTFLKYDQGKCLTYYFYFIDELLGLCYVRVPTWLPFKLQVFFNGHAWLSNNLTKKNIAHQMMDNAFISIDDWNKAQKISDNLSVDKLHKKLSGFAEKYCPVHKLFKQQYHWSIMQCEYSTDIVFKKQEDLKPLYGQLIEKAIHSVKPDNIISFFGKKMHGKYEGEVGNNYHVRIEGSRIKHSMGKASIKMYDKFAHILRIETTVNDVTFFKHYREVIHRDGTSTQKEASMKKNIYSLKPLKEIVAASNQRYLEFISAIDDDTIGHKKLEKVTEIKTVQERNYKGLNFFSKADKKIILTLARGEFNIYGFRCKDLAKHLVHYSSDQLSRLLKRLRVHGLVKKIGNSYKYYLTKLGKEVITCSQKVINMVMIPQLSKAV
jgi:DNA-binding HxlR family transcriptional regulator